MLREIFLIIVAVTIALAGGIYTAEQASLRFEGFNSITYGLWKAHPLSGSASADPYSRAHDARSGQMALGSAEGLAFIASNDAAGNPLRGQCSYIIAGQTPQARAWTLRIVDEDLRLISPQNNAPDAISSDQILRSKDTTFSLTVSNTIEAGNWFFSSHTGPIKFVMTLYDTSVASNTGVAEVKMPNIKLVDCTDA